jgi:hypothetical protein
MAAIASIVERSEGADAPASSGISASGFIARRTAKSAYATRNATPEQLSEPEDARRDQRRVGHRAEQHDWQHVFAANALPQHERVLHADRDDERETEAEAGERDAERSLIHEHALQPKNARA